MADADRPLVAAQVYRDQMDVASPVAGIKHRHSPSHLMMYIFITFKVVVIIGLMKTILRLCNNINNNEKSRENEPHLESFLFNAQTQQLKLVDSREYKLGSLRVPPEVSSQSCHRSNRSNCHRPNT